jgi:hypothetical protein
MLNTANARILAYANVAALSRNRRSGSGSLEARLDWTIQSFAANDQGFF